MFKSNELMIILNLFRKIRYNDEHMHGYWLNSTQSFVTKRLIDGKVKEMSRFNFKITQNLFDEILIYQKYSQGSKLYVAEYTDENHEALIMYDKDYYYNEIIPRKRLLAKLQNNDDEIFNIDKDYYKIKKSVILTEWNPKTDKKKTAKKSEEIRIADLNINEIDLFLKAIS